MRRLGAGLAASVLVRAGGVPEGAVDGTLPGGIGIAVDIETPLSDTVIPKGATTVVGTASTGTKAATAATSLVYVLDSSGSFTNAGWEAEKQAVAEFHQQVAQQPYLGMDTAALAAISTTGRVFWTGPAAGPRFHDALGRLQWRSSNPRPIPRSTMTVLSTSTTPASPGGPPPAVALPGNRQVSFIPRGGVDTGNGTAAP